ncbi:MAG: disulfide bond formation protein DsbA [Actinomycetota bacterium]|nr:disulfide bond formation protein DsbA [Actinomycetota bacterium]
MTARWVVDEVAAERDLNITWQPISLLFKNEPAEDSPYYGAVVKTHNQLRVMEAVRAELGDEPIFKLYWELGSRIHHDGDRDFDVADALTAVGLDTKFAAAHDDESWDKEIRTRMDAGLDLVGTDVGTPIISWDRTDGDRVGLFGPVITRVPKSDDSLKLWDAMITMGDIDGFWELKKTRTERPEFGDRPII